MQLEELISGAREVVSAKDVYGPPYEKNGLTVIPAAAVRGGGGAGRGDGEGGESGAGGGFGLTARPSGAWIVEDGRVQWRPAFDLNRIVLGGQVVALAAVLVAGRVLLARSPHRPPLRARVTRLRARPHRHGPARLRRLAHR